ncbi:hypothetical protein ACROYT_G014650 [Oculina patagonica]
MRCVQRYWNVGSPPNSGGSTIQSLDSLNSNLKNTFSYRDTKWQDEQKFVNELKDAPWNTAFVFEDTDDIVDSWYKIFTDVLDSLIPVKEKRVKNRAQQIWFTTEINKHIKKRNKLLKKGWDFTSGINKPQFTIPHITPQKVEELLQHMPFHKA